MSRTSVSSTPAPDRKDSQSSKRVLSSPLSPEDHLTKKNKAAMDKMVSLDSYAEPLL